MIKSRLSRRSILAGAGALALPAGFGTPARAEEKLVRYGISMADIPLTTGQPDRGAGAYQFTGLTIYDPLVAWEMDVADRPGKLVPGLATEWKVDDKDKTKWRFALRKGVKFHDGSDFNADAVIFSIDRVLDDKSPAFDRTGRGVLIAESVHPNKAHIGGRGINMLTGAEAVAPFGGAAFHDNKVWLKKVSAAFPTP